jgi:phosphoribosylglycinamide formyltransferase 1
LNTVIPKRIVILVSGEGTNAENILKFFENRQEVEICGIICNRKEAGIYHRVVPYKKEVIHISNSEIIEGKLLSTLHQLYPDLIVLAGFLVKIPESITDAFSHKIINLHPSLLPKHGGKGMYGNHVHQAVINSGDNKSGITIHYVNSEYDQGAVIKQVEIPISNHETVESLSKKIQELEHYHFPKEIEKLIKTP